MALTWHWILCKLDVMWFAGRTLIRMNEIKLEKMGITNVEHR